VTRHTDHLEISVADNGPGIARSEQSRVFEEFYRTRFEDYAVRGSGLGLAIARSLASQLDGDIALESQEGNGSTFTLTIPREPTADEAPL
jgi:two-component system sensor histidine kinase SenX3